MGIPLNLLISYDQNLYELTNAMIKRSSQVALTGDEDIEKYNGKVVSTSIGQVLSKKVEFKRED
ncbi:hypothetical protein [Spirochaeta cellobiosiphila]|uniref:hypothetical protein n=1 Tax=Spirochaeta cellobiosiphila TaxID=504483 RepID=UPI0003F7FBA5|nr:hypothetical protein [Spirochaeta cellobiosiphila]